MKQRVEAFVQAVEVWVPDGERLRHHSGAYGDLTEFARVSARKTFRAGEGLPGRVWSTGHPEILKDIGPLFVRAELARAAGIEVAVGFPLFRGEELTAIVTLLCGRRSRTCGCIELWDVDAANGRIVHAGGYYGTLEKFEKISALLQFEIGAGLPGMVWERGQPVLIENLQGPDAFSRASLARECGLEAGFGIPIYRGREVAHVLVLLSAQATPLVRAFELWVPDGDEMRLARSLGPAGAASLGSRPILGSGELSVASVLKSPLPVVFERAGPPGPAGNFDGKSFELGVGIPVHDGERVRAVAVLLT